MNLIIKRDIWLRGEGFLRSYLLRGDGKMCCLGQFAEQCGVPKKKLSFLSNITYLKYYENDTMNQYCRTSEQRKILDKLIEVNDSQDMEESGREKEVIRLFKSLGVSVSFE